MPMKTELADNPRCRLVQGDFFAMAASEDGFDRDQPGRQYDALLIDIDHTPERLLHGGSKGFYTPEGLRAVQRFVKPAGSSGCGRTRPRTRPSRPCLARRLTRPGPNRWCSQTPYRTGAR